MRNFREAIRLKISEYFGVLQMFMLQCVMMISAFSMSKNGVFMVKKGCFHGGKTPKTQLKNAVFEEKNGVFVYRKRRFPTRAWYFRV